MACVWEYGRRKARKKEKERMYARVVAKTELWKALVTGAERENSDGVSQ